jgi:TPP-dependent pyruvate/acetoin dehydrogenase alpha subunit
MSAFCIDGNDAVAVYLETKRAADRARKGEGPTLIEAKTYRHGGHHVNDPGLYMDQKVLEEWKTRDPISLLGKKIKTEEAKQIQEQVDVELAEAVEFAKNSGEPSVEEFLAGIQKY